MAFKRFASFDVISSVLVPEGATTSEARSLVEGGTAFHKVGHRHEFDYEPRPGYLYIRSRAISSRCNDNFDEFPADEIEKAYASFVGKPVFVNHHNANHRRMRGVIIDAALHKDANPDGSPDTWAEVLMEVDAVRFPKLAEAILKGHIERTSMGTDVAFSICSACNNKATTPAEYCQHIPKMKGQRLYRTTASGKKEGILIREICHGLGFFENSLLVEEPADPTAYFLGVDARGLGKAASLDTKAASLRAVVAEDIHLDPDAIREMQDAHSAGEMHREMGDHADHRVVDLGDHHDVKAHLIEAHGWDSNDFYRNSHEEDHPRMDPASGDDRPLRPHEIIGAHAHEHEVQYPDDYKDAVTLGNSHFHTAGLGKAAGLFDKRRKQGPLEWPKHDVPDSANDTCPDCTHSMDRHHMGAGGHEMGCQQCACRKVMTGPGSAHTGSKTALTPMAPGGSAQTDPSEHLGRDKGQCSVCGSDIYRVGDNWQHDIASGAGVPHMAVPGGMGNDDDDAKGNSLDKASSFYLTAVGPKYPDPSEHPSWQATHLHADHVVEHYGAATDAEKAAGKSWYTDAHHLAKAISKTPSEPEGNAHKGAGVLSAYSPQNNWPANIFAAHRSFREGRAIGPGEGPTVMRMHQNAAQKIMNGEHHQDALKGPKTQDFAHLIEHGGNAEGSERKRVVIDRHALSVAAGRRVPKDEAEKLGSAMGNRHYYEHAAGVYRQATDKINEGKPKEEHVEPHQVQAVTWLVRQRRNAAEDDANESSAYRNRAKGRQKAEHNVRQKMQDELLQHHPDMGGNSHVQAAKTSAKDTKKVRMRDLAGEVTPDGRTCTHVTHHHLPFTPGTMPQTSTTAYFDDGSTWNDNHSAWFEVKKQPKQAAKLAFGETKAPADVDTLRDEECPVCSNTDSYDGNECQVCGFVAPPAMFQDPNLDLAKQLDLHKDVAQDAGSLPGQPDAIPGEEVPGSDAVPVDPSMVNDDGTVVPTTDPEQIVQQQADQLADGVPLDPDQLGPDGQPVFDPEGEQKHVNQGGEPFTPGPNLPGQPGDPEGPESPVTEDAEGVIDPSQIAEDGQPLDAAAPGAGDPGQPNDGVPDLQCPACGFQADGAQPESTNMDDPTDDAVAEGSGGMMAGDVCPNCQKATLASVGELEQIGAPV